MHHVLKIIIVSNGDQRVKILSRKLILKQNISNAAAHGGELGGQDGESDPAVYGENLGLSVNVSELVIVRTWLNLAARAAHEPHFVALVVVFIPWRRVIEIDLARSRR